MTSSLANALRSRLAPTGWELGRDGIARHAGRQIEFFNGLTPARVFAEIAASDADRFDRLAVLVVKTNVELHHVRSDRLANRYPRVFFLSEEELLQGPATLRKPRGGQVRDFQAEVVANEMVGGPQTGYYILTFRSPAMEEVLPPQFVMMDVTTERPLLAGRTVRRRDWKLAVDITPQPLLKRPFGIQRAYYRHFTREYLCRLNLPTEIAELLHIVYPYQFDMLYKVLPSGVGTSRMTALRRGDKVHMLGPLGTPFDVRSLATVGIREVHVIGGGVGMAPLVLFVQALRYHGYQVRAFIGIGKLDMLRFRGDVDYAFAEEADNAFVYVDDLLEAGVTAENIYLAFDAEMPPGPIRGIPVANLHHGLVTEQYQQFLAACAPAGAMAFTCGPDRMMELVAGIAQASGVPLKVLMEKRMGCGFGVCLSCVCKVRGPAGDEHYERVCTEGPLFDAENIVWTEPHSQPISAASPCAARC